jgi:hypothetical protein
MSTRMTPVASRRVRTAVAGGVWSFAGIMLLAWAVVWVSAVTFPAAVAIVALGVAIAVPAWRFGFARLVSANITRLAAKPDLACVFGFQAVKSYLVMIGMIAFGITLRHSGLPHTWLAVMYSGVGGALFLASIGYYRALSAKPVEVNQ